ncbi:TetR/AcrR family transcriptional regulator [Virgibacillus dakarensis]|nr:MULTISPECIES: helix-turn-helix domain-containing protein [Bacillaceae]MBT2216522.1 TetR/AcrR family transcriptional regulator [Virgibacillus dakarensis]
MNEKLMLIEKSMNLLARKGYHTTSIQEIATAAVVSKGAFYLYF